MNSFVVKLLLLFFIFWFFLIVMATILSVKAMRESNYSIGKIILWIYMIFITSGVILPFIPSNKSKKCRT